MAVCGINAQLLTEANTYRRAGIHVYLSEVLRHLPEDESLQYQVFSTYPPPENQSALLEWFATPPFSASPVGRIAWEQLVWPFQSYRTGCDLIHGAAFALPLFGAKPAVVTIFDLSFIHHPDLFPPLRRLYLRWATATACKRADKVIAISQSGKKDLIGLLDIEESKIRVIYPGVRPQFKRPEQHKIDAFKREKQLPDRFVLHVGTLQPRKNLVLLIDAFHQAQLDNAHLVSIE